jgi:hypothetical protein
VARAVVCTDTLHLAPSDAAVVVLGAATGDAVTHALDATSLLGIDVQQFAGRRSLAADDRSGRLGEFSRDRHRRCMQGLTQAAPRPACIAMRQRGRRWRRIASS